MYSKRVLRYPGTWQKLDSIYYPNFCNTASKTLPHYCLTIALLYLATISDSLNALSTLHQSTNNFALVANIYLCLPFLSPSWILHLWQDDLVFHTQFRAFQRCALAHSIPSASNSPETTSANPTHLSKTRQTSDGLLGDGIFPSLELPSALSGPQCLFCVWKQLSSLPSGFISFGTPILFTSFQHHPQCPVLGVWTMPSMLVEYTIEAPPCVCVNHEGELGSEPLPQVSSQSFSSFNGGFSLLEAVNQPCAFLTSFHVSLCVEEKLVWWWSRRWKAKFQFTMSWNNPFFQEVPEIAWETT